MINVKKINDLQVKKIGMGKQKEILHKELFNDSYPNIFVCGKTGSGKTNLLYTLLINLAFHYKDEQTTKIFIISTTLDEDEKMQKIIEKLGKYNEIIAYDDMDEKTFDSIIEQIKFSKEDDDFIFARNIIVFDDMRKFLRNKNIGRLLAKIRHYKSIAIILSQHFYDIDPGSRFQLKFLILFGKIPEKILQTIYDEYVTNVSFEKFKVIYEKATAEKFSFLYIDINNRKFRKNLDEEFEI